MANNLHISYDLYKPGQEYEAVEAEIKKLGDAIKVHRTFWYVNSTKTAKEACDAVWKVMDSNDTIYVVDATNNSASWENLSDETGKFIRDRWKK